jgi:hypothetical protein
MGVALPSMARLAVSGSHCQTSDRDPAARQTPVSYALLLAPVVHGAPTAVFVTRCPPFVPALQQTRCFPKECVHHPFRSDPDDMLFELAAVSD